MLETLITDLLDLASIENNQFKLEKEYSDLVVMFQEALQITLFEANKKNINIKLILDKKVHLPMI